MRCARPTIYTTGYLAGWTPEALTAAVAEKGAVLCDIRFMPQSRVPGWNRVQLERLMGARYRHLKELGNRNYKGGEISLMDLAEGLQKVDALFDRFDNVILMCACRDRQRCHRRLVADEASLQLDVPTAELYPPAGPQMTLFAEGTSG